MRTLLRLFQLIFHILLTDAHLEEIFVRSGDMVALQCPSIRTMPMDKMDTNPTWTSYTPHKMMLTSSMNSTSHLLLHKRSLILLSVSVDQQGNYTCSVGNNTFWFKLSVYTTLSNDIEKRVQFSVKCYTQQPCSLKCPVSNTPASNIPNMTGSAITWTKGDKTVFKTVLSFSSVEEKDYGVYTCTRSYLYHGQIFNMSFTNILTVKPQEPLPDVRILSPQNSDVYEVDLGSPFVVNCMATLYSDFDEIYWVMESSSVDNNNNARIHTMVRNTNETDMIASLIFKEVLKEDLSKQYTCKLESVSVHSSSVTISLAQKKHISSLFAIVCSAVIILVIAVTAICTTFKMNIFLYLRDRLGCHSKCSDPKAYDVYLMRYKSESDMALSEDDTQWLKNVLEKNFGYKLCLHHSTVSASEKKTVLDCIQQSRAVILVPTVSKPGPDCSPDLYKEHNIHVIHIQTERENRSNLKLKVQLQDALPLLGNTEQRSVTWKGTASRKPSSVFCKELRHLLPPPQRCLQDIVTEVYCEK